MYDNDNDFNEMIRIINSVSIVDDIEYFCLLIICFSKINNILLLKLLTMNLTIPPFHFNYFIGNKHRTF